MFDLVQVHLKIFKIGKKKNFEFQKFNMHDIELLSVMFGEFFKMEFSHF